MGRDKKYNKMEFPDDSLAVERQIQELERVARSNPRTLLSLEDAPFWVFKKGLNKAMRDVHGLVRKRLD
jgi:hypothetical protein